jgi:hypothetical protein
MVLLTSQEQTFISNNGYKHLWYIGDGEKSHLEHMCTPDMSTSFNKLQFYDLHNQESNTYLAGPVVWLSQRVAVAASFTDGLHLIVAPALRQKWDNPTAHIPVAGPFDAPRDI